MRPILNSPMWNLLNFGCWILFPIKRPRQMSWESWYFTWEIFPRTSSAMEENNLKMVCLQQMNPVRPMKPLGEKSLRTNLWYTPLIPILKIVRNRMSVWMDSAMKKKQQFLPMGLPAILLETTMNIFFRQKGVF